MKRKHAVTSEAAIKEFLDQTGCGYIELYLGGLTKKGQAMAYKKMPDVDDNVIAVIDLKKLIAKRKSLKGVESRMRKAIRGGKK